MAFYLSKEFGGSIWLKATGKCPTMLDTDKHYVDWMGVANKKKKLPNPYAVLEKSAGNFFEFSNQFSRAENFINAGH